MDKEEDNYSASFSGLNYSADHQFKPQNKSREITEYMQRQISSGFCTITSLADSEPEGLYQTTKLSSVDQETGVEDIQIPPLDGDAGVSDHKKKRKRPTTVKTNEEVETQRMIHIAVERNRRKQANQHLHVLRSLMPASYVQRGDQASIIGGAIEFVRELEQLLQCLESQKRRRRIEESSLLEIQQNQMNSETAENKSCLADVEVKVLGLDGIIKILSRRRPGQLIKTIAGLEDLQLNIMHTNITTIEQTVLYSFNVKIGSETGLTAQDKLGSTHIQFHSCM